MTCKYLSTVYGYPFPSTDILCPFNDPELLDNPATIENLVEVVILG